MTESFYRNIAALQQGSTACAEHERVDFNTWVINQLEVRQGDSVLNVGCGTVFQTLTLAQAVGYEGHVLAIDRSYTVLQALSQTSQKNGLEQRIRFLYLHLDDLGGHLRREDFDRALGTRALYHVRQPQEVFRAVHQALKPGGIFFFYGPSRKDLAELRLFQAALHDEASPQENRALLFIERIGLPCARDVFPQVEVIPFENPLRFDSAADFYACWRESRLYDETLEQEFQQAAVSHFQSHPVFETSQRLIGVRAIK
jgi:SAM-dependent methyltransferase